MLVIAIIVGGVVVYDKMLSSENLLKIETSEGKIYTVNIEIADTPEKQTTGLMFRKSLGKDSGMLFPYTSERNLSFWMKNTLIPLDMIFINSKLEIVDIIREVPPCEKDPCESYSPIEKAQYVLEVNGSFSENYNINVGDKVSIF